MKRDGATTSLWQHNIQPYVSKTLHLPNQAFDVIIAGGGVTGITTGLQLQKAGKKCLIAEAQSLCFGTTGGTTAHLNTFFDTYYDRIKKDFGEDAIQLVASATGKALDLYKSNIEEYAIDCGYQQKDGYLYSQNEKQTEQLDKIFEASKLAGVDVSYTDRIPVPVEFEKAIVYHEQAQIHPARYVYALAKAFEEAGGVILQNCSIENVVETEGMVTVQTNLGGAQASYLIYATHIPPGVNLLHFRCAPYRSYAMAVKLKSENYPDGLAYDMYDPYHYYRTQEIDGEKYFIVGGEDHKTGHEENTEACFNKLEAHVSKYFEADKIAFKWSSQYFEPSDGLAYIGLLPGSSGNILVATGYGGNGMTYSHIAAPLLTDLITKKENAYAALFNPNRVKPVAGFSNFVKENADVVALFIEKRISTEKLKELAGMAPGEGRIVKYEGEKLAIYKDEAGQLHAVNPVCTHVKCIVQWNGAEKSWDCPCHGARYSVDGKVMTGPAQKDLEIVALIDLVAK
jgi:glycine/D-amino acid oxidase-like deaminating enzyme/nitrite reductase/ring-hydroxylating ferredoxin subunit